MGKEPFTVFEGLLSPAPSFCICSSLLLTHNQRSAVWTVGHALAALQPPSFPCVLDGPLSTVPLGEPWRLPSESLPPPSFPGSVTACLQSLGSRVLGWLFPTVLPAQRSCFRAGLNCIHLRIAGPRRLPALGLFPNEQS